MPNKDDIIWFKQQFQTRINSALQGTPFSVDMLTAIACQETGEIWPILRRKSLSTNQILELCVGDSLDESSTASPRSAFPKNKKELVEHPNGLGQEMFDIAHQALVDMAEYIPGYSAVAKKPTKICHGFGIFQYDLQYFPKDPHYFLEKRYADFDACLGKCLNELQEVVKVLGWKSKSSLSDEESAAVAIAYNIGPGRYKAEKGLKQGYRPPGGKYYGEQFFDYLLLSKATVVESAHETLSPTNITGVEPLVEVKPAALEVASMTHLPLTPKAGDLFTLIVELNREIEAADGDVKIVFQVQRLVPALGGSPDLRPASYNTYFDEDFLPQPITIPAGSKFGFSNPLKVRKDASVPDGEMPVSFPEKLLLSAFINHLEKGFMSDVIQINSRDAEIKKPVVAVAESSNPQTSTLGIAPPAAPEKDLVLGQKVPNMAEIDVVGTIKEKIKRGTPAFNALFKNMNPDVVFKDEEGTGADRIMTNNLAEKINLLAALVKAEWPGVKLRITEAWDENNEHSSNSVHYEARGADMTTSDIDKTKLGRLGRLAVKAGFDWVFYENSAHVHASVKR